MVCLYVTLLGGCQAPIHHTERALPSKNFHFKMIWMIKNGLVKWPLMEQLKPNKYNYDDGKCYAHKHLKGRTTNAKQVDKDYELFKNIIYLAFKWIIKMRLESLLSVLIAWLNLNEKITVKMFKCSVYSTECHLRIWFYVTIKSWAVWIGSICENENKLLRFGF